MNRRRDILLAIVVSVGLSVGVMFLMEREDVAPVRADPLDARLRSLIARIEALEARLGISERDSAADRPSLAEENARFERAFAEWDERVRTFDARLNHLEDAAPADVRGSKSPRPTPKPDRDSLIKQAKKVVASSSATAEEKVAAHLILRRIRDAYTPRMVQDLCTIGSTDPNDEIRANVWRGFDGASHLPEIVPFLLQALDDAAPAVRNEASETLGNYADDPDVLAALRAIAQNDPAREVRNKARRTLRQVEPGR